MNLPQKALLASAKQRAVEISTSQEYEQFVDFLRIRYPSRFQLRPEVLERDYLRIVDHHLHYLVPRVQPYIGCQVRRVLDFGCGSGGSAIALAMADPEVHCFGTDIDPEEILVARRRASIYNVSGRCDFHDVIAGQPLPFPDAVFDFCLCSSVLEYCIDVDTRRFCIQEMVRLLRPNGLLFVSVPNRLYPFEIHTLKWGWNYFPDWFGAEIVDSTFWEVRRLARPVMLKLYRTSITQLFRPWTNFCLEKSD